MCLHRRHKSMSNLMICNNFFLLVRKYSIFLLISCNNNFDALLEICFCHHFTIISDSTKSCFIYNIGKFCTGSSGCHSRNCMEIHIIRKLHFLCMYFKDCLTSLKIRQFHRNTTVKTSRTGKCRVKGFRTVGRCQNDNTIVSFKSIHLRKQLVQCLLTFIISTCHLAITFLSDSINFINKYDTRCFFLCLFKEITDFGSTHTYKHLDKFRSGHGKERNIGFPGYCFCQHSFTGTWRAYEQHSFRHRSANFGVFFRIMQIIHNFLQIFFCFFFTGNITEANTFR